MSWKYLESTSLTTSVCFPHQEAIILTIILFMVSSHISASFFIQFLIYISSHIAEKASAEVAPTTWATRWQCFPFFFFFTINNRKWWPVLKPIQKSKWAIRSCAAWESAWSEWDWNLSKSGWVQISKRGKSEDKAEISFRCFIIITFYSFL